MEEYEDYSEGDAYLEEFNRLRQDNLEYETWKFLGNKSINGVSGSDRAFIKNIDEACKPSVKFFKISVTGSKSFFTLINLLFERVIPKIIVFDNTKFISVDIDGSEPTNLDGADNLLSTDKANIKLAFQILFRLSVLRNCEYLTINKYNLGNPIQGICLCPKLKEFVSIKNDIKKIDLRLNKELVNLGLISNGHEFKELDLKNLKKLKKLNISDSHHTVKLLNKKEAINLQQIVGDYNE